MTTGTEQRLAALMFTDIVGSVALQNRLGTERYTRFIARHDELFKTCLSHVESARILNETGDGFLVRFGSATDAVNTALRLQYVLNDEICEGEPMQLRIGLHLGEVTEMEESVRGEKRAVGMAINLASRIMDLADGSQILMTRPIFDDARQFVREHPSQNDADESPPLQWMAHGRYIFKGNDEPMDIYEVGADEIAPMLPPSGSEKAKRAVAADEEDALGWRPGVGLQIPRHEHWVIEKKIGVGGFGEVWLAKHNSTKEERVFKFCFDPERLRSFRRELTLFRLLRDALGKRNDIAALYDVSVESPPFYLESEYVPTGNLAEWMEARGGVNEIPLETRLDLIARTARAADAAHSVGIVHKDIKPSNVLIAIENGEPRPRLADFGIGRLADASALDEFGITQAGFTQSIVLESESSNSMTQLYAPPEYLVGTTASVKGDIYSLGVMLYQMAAGDLRRPLASGWRRDIKDELLREEIEKCVDVDPARRFDSAGELAERLNTLDDRRKQLDEHRRVTELKRQAKKRRRIIGLAAATCLGLAILSAVLGKAYFEQKRLKEEAEQLKADARTMASQSDFLLAGQLLERNRNGEAVAYLARALRSDPGNQAAFSTLTSTLAYHNFLPPAYPPIKTQGHDARTGFLGRFNDSGDQLLAVDGDSKLSIWNVESGTTLRAFEHSGQRIFDAAFTAGDLRVIAVTVADDAKDVGRTGSRVRMWKADNGSLVRQEPQDENIELRPVWLSSIGSHWIAAEVEKDANGIVSNFTLQLWDLRTPDWKVTKCNRTPGNLIPFIELTPDGTKLVAVSTDAFQGKPRDLSVLDLAQGENAEWQKIVTAKPWSGPPMKAAISPDSKQFASPNADGTVDVYSLESLEKVHTFTHTGDMVLSLKFSPDSQFLGVGYLGRNAIVWDLTDGEHAGPALNHDAGVWSIEISPDSTGVLTCSMDQTAVLWDFRTGQAMTQPLRHDGYVMSGKFTGDGSRACTLSLNGTAAVWNLTGGGARGTPLRQLGSSILAINDDWSSVITRGDRSQTVIRDLESGKVTRELPGKSGYVRHAQFVDGNDDILAVRQQDRVERHRLNHGEPEIHSIPGQGMRRLIKLSRDGNIAITADEQATTTLHMWRLDKKDAEPVKITDLPAARAVSLSADGLKGVCSSTLSRGLTVWDASGDGPPVVRTMDTIAFPFSHDISSDGSKVLVGSAEGSVQLWDFDSGKPLTRTLSQAGVVVTVAFSEDEKQAAALSLERDDDWHLKSVHVWDLKSEQAMTPPMKLLGIQPTVQKISSFPTIRFHSDGDRLLVQAGEHTRVLHLRPVLKSKIPAWVPDAAESIVGSKLNADGKPTELAYESLFQTRGRLEKFSGDSSAEKWFQWLVADRRNRPVSPNTDWTREDYVGSLLEQGTTMRNAIEALKISPMNPAALAILADNLAPNGNDGSFKPSLAAWYAKLATSALGGETAMRSRTASAGDIVPSRPDTSLVPEAVKAVSIPRIRQMRYGLSQRAMGFKALARARKKLGDWEGASQKNHAAARKAYEDAFFSIARAAQESPDDPDARLQMAEACARLGDAAAKRNNLKSADALYRLALIEFYLLDEEGFGRARKPANHVFHQCSTVAHQMPGHVPAPKLISEHSTWKYFDGGTYPGNVWTAVEFDDSSWNEGIGPFGYGDDREATKLSDGGDPQNRHVTTWFRKEFAVSNTTDIANPLIEFQRDDGLVVYLNGKEIGRSNLRRGPVNQQSLAVEIIRDENETAWHSLRVPPGIIHAGKNVIAVELHQQKPSSTDCHFDLQLTGNAPTLEDLIASITLEELNKLITNSGGLLPEKLQRKMRFILSAKLDPNTLNRFTSDGRLWVRRAIILRSRGKLDESLTAVDKAIDVLTKAPNQQEALVGARYKRVQILRDQNRIDEAQAAYRRLKGIPERSTNLTSKEVNLDHFYNAGFTESWHSNPELPMDGIDESNSLAGLPVGNLELAGIRFDVRGLIQLNGNGFSRGDQREFPQEVVGIPVGSQGTRMRFLHAVAFGQAQATATPVIGEYLIQYDNGTTVEVPVILGKDIGDWHLTPAIKAANEALPAAEQMKIAWLGSNLSTQNRGAELALYISTWENPNPEETIKSFDFRSTMTRAAPFLVATTLE